MTFVKLDTGIIDSTLWIDANACRVFLAALMLAYPHEVLEPTEALEVRKLKPSGFVVQPGWYGFVPTPGPGIVNRALLPQEAGMAALERLSQPDQESRSSDHGGRRMVRVDGGYIILNYIKYREKDHTTAERSKRYRERNKAGTPSRRDDRDAVTLNGPVTRDVTHVDADVEEEEEEEEEESKKTRMGYATSFSATPSAQPARDGLNSPSSTSVPEPSALLGNCAHDEPQAGSPEGAISPAAAPPPPRAKSHTPKRSSEHSYPPEFEAAWDDYPKRAGSNPRRGAYHAWRARRKEGHSAEELHAAVSRYAVFARADGSWGTQYVMQASSFFGVSKAGYLEPWTIEPKPNGAGGQREARPLPIGDELRQGVNPDGSF